MEHLFQAGKQEILIEQTSNNDAGNSTQYQSSAMAAGTSNSSTNPASTYGGAAYTAESIRSLMREATDSNIVLSRELFAVLHNELENHPISESSKRVYLSRLRQFAAFVESSSDQIVSDGRLTLGQAAWSFLDQLRLQTDKAHTVNNFMTLIRLLLRLAGEPTSGFANIPIEVREKTVLSREEQLLYLESAKQESSSRAYALALLFLLTDVTSGESTRLKTSDLTWKDGWLYLSIQGRQGDRTTVVPQGLSQAIRVWLIERQRSLKQPSDFLFPGRAGSGLSPSTLDYALRKIGWKVKLEVSSRILRDTYSAINR